MKSLFCVIAGLLAILLVCCFLSCGGGGNGEKQYYDITVAWNPNIETLVNSPGGGYRVYYSQTADFALNGSNVQVHDVPYTSGSLAPTQTTLTLHDGTWYIKIAAYFTLNGGSESAPSSQQIVTLP